MHTFGGAQFFPAYPQFLPGVPFIFLPGRSSAAISPSSKIPGYSPIRLQNQLL
jgi:hypothetical protein